MIHGARKASTTRRCRRRFLRSAAGRTMARPLRVSAMRYLCSGQLQVLLDLLVDPFEALLQIRDLARLPVVDERGEGVLRRRTIRRGRDGGALRVLEDLDERLEQLVVL